MITIRSGTYHNAMFNYDYTLLFKCIDDIYKKGMRAEFGTNYFYMLDEVLVTDDYLIGRMTAVQENGKYRAVPNDTNTITTNDKKNEVITTIMFYMNSENDIVMEEKSRLPRDQFVKMLCELISKYTELNLPENAPIMGHKFEVSFDRYDNQSVKQFLDSISVLEYMEMRIRVWSNPHRDPKFEDLKNKLLDTHADVCNMKGSDLNKDADLIRTTEGMVEDGHIDLKLSGKNGDGDPEEYNSNSNQDDKYTLKQYDNDLETFKERISGIIRSVRDKHSRR